MKDIIYDIIRTPVITEKATILSEFNKVVFKVRTDANKASIKEAVEHIFGVKVEKVNTIKIPGKVKRFRGKVGKRSSYKKAIISLKEGETIDVMGGIK